MKDSVWAQEPGIQVAIERSEGNGFVRLEIWDINDSGRPVQVLGGATIADWRWNRLVKAVELDPKTQTC